MVYILLVRNHSFLLGAASEKKRSDFFFAVYMPKYNIEESAINQRAEKG